MPGAITLDGRGNLFVADTDNGRVQKFNDGRFMLKFGSSDSDNRDYLGSPSGVAVWDSTRDIYVSSRSTDSIHVFDYSGRFLFDFDSFGKGGTLRNPSQMLIYDDMLYISDSGNDRIIILKLVDGNTCPSDTDKVEDGVCFVEKFGRPGTGNGRFDEPTGLAFDGANSLLYVADTGNDRIQVFEMAGGNTCPSDTDKVEDGVCFVEKFGRPGTGNGRFDEPTGLAFDGANSLLYVADTGNDRIQVLSLGTQLAKAPGPPVNIRAMPASPTAVIVTWEQPRQHEGASEITGYKIEYKKGSQAYKILDGDTGNAKARFTHTGLETGTAYTYRIYLISADGTSSASSVTETPEETTAPSGLVADVISPNQAKLYWHAPSNTFGQKITGYEIKRVFANGEYDVIGTTNAKTTTFVAGSLATGKSYSFAVSATLGFGSSNESATVTATPSNDFEDIASITNSYAEVPDRVPDAPARLSATGISPDEIRLSWDRPPATGSSSLIGYKIEYKKDAGPFATLISNTNSAATTYKHANLPSDSRYTYQVYAINKAGIGDASNRATASPLADTVRISPMEKLTVNGGEAVSFSVMLDSGDASNVTYSLESGPPAGAKINPTTGLFSWMPDKSQGGLSHMFDVVVKKGPYTDRQTVTITVMDSVGEEPEEPMQEAEPDTPVQDTDPIAPFVDPGADPQYYVDRYNDEAAYRNWFDSNYPQYPSIYEAVGLDPTEHGGGDSMEPAVQEDRGEFGECGPGTALINGTCSIVPEVQGGGCLIATAAYGSELASQVQSLREIRDGQVMGTPFGSAFMGGFNHVYYSFSPHIADYQRENATFREMVRLGITPLVTSLGLMSMAETDGEVLGYGMIVILMNVGMYVAAPAMASYGIILAKNRFGGTLRNPI